MKHLSSALLASLALLFVACSSESSPEPAKPAPATETPPADAPATEAPAAEAPATDAPSTEDLVAKMRKDIEALEAKPEHTAPRVKVQHLLVSFKGAGVPNVRRSKEEAEVLAAEIWKKLADGADFDYLIREYTNDSPPGIYTMALTGTSGQVPGVGMVYARSGMVPAFGNVGWRLEVGELGIAPWDAAKSRYGWHIIKRLE